MGGGGGGLIIIKRVLYVHVHTVYTVRTCIKLHVH